MRGEKGGLEVEVEKEKAAAASRKLFHNSLNPSILFVFRAAETFCFSLFF